MPEFKTKEEYEKWKSEKIKSNEKRAQKLEEEEKLRNIWICPECMSSNNKSQHNCQCGFTIDENTFQYFRGNLTPVELYKIRLNCSENSLPIMSQYLLKRFPDSEEAQQIKALIDSYSQEVICGKCGFKNVYNSKYLKKNKCDRCGEWLYQFATASVSVPDKARTVMKCPYCREEISDKSSRCKHCAGEIMTCSKCAKTVGVKVEKQFVGLLRGGYRNEMICMSCGKSLGQHASSNPSMWAMVIGAIILLWWLFKKFA